MEARANNSRPAAPTFNSFREGNSEYKALRQWGLATVVPIGVVGNIFILIVVLRRRNRAISCAIYMAALAVCDTFVLLTSAYKELFRYMYYTTDFTSVNGTFNCKLSEYMVLSSAQSGVMIVMAMLAERVIAVTVPFKAGLWLSPKRAAKVCLALITLTFLYNGPVIYTAGKLTGPRIAFQTCMVYPKRDPLSTAHSVIGLFLNGIIPFLAISTMNCVIVYFVKSSKKAVRSESIPDTKAVPSPQVPTPGEIAISSAVVKLSVGSTSASSGPADDDHGIPRLSQRPDPEPKREPKSAEEREPKSEPKAEPKPTQKSEPQAEGDANPEADRNQDPGSVKNPKSKSDGKMRARERQLTVMTVVISLVFLLLTMPRYAYLVWLQISQYSVLEHRAGEGRGQAPRWPANVSQLLYITNSACNFFLYFISGAKFRSELCQVLRCKC